MIDFGTQIKNILSEKNMTQKELGHKLGLTGSAISSLLNRDNISIDKLEMLASALDCSIDIHFISNTENNNHSINTKANSISTPHLLFDLRTKSGLTQTQAAKELDVDYSSYISYENGTQTAPLNFLLKACKLYNVSPSYFDINNNLSAVGNKGYSVTQKNNKKTIVGTNDSIEVSDDEFEAVKQFLEIIRNRK